MPRKRTSTRSRVVTGGRGNWVRPVDDGTPMPPPASEMLPEGQRADHAVYFIMSADMAPLYIGSTSQLLRRLQTHAAQRDWFTPDCRIFVEWYIDRDDALLREANAIHSTRPAHNRRMDEPSAPSPEPDIPLRPLTDLDRDIAALCTNCEAAPVRAVGRCSACLHYQERYGTERPVGMADPYLAGA